MSRALCWIRRDLRLSDHRALFEACAFHDEVAVVFVFDSSILGRIEDKSNRRVTFLMHSLQEVDQGLRDRGSRLVIRFGDPVVEIPKLAHELSATAVYSARDYEPSAMARDHWVHEAFEGFRSVKDQVIFEPDEVLSQSNTSFRVFTPYSRRWLEKFDSRADIVDYEPDLSKLIPAGQLDKYSLDLDFALIGFQEQTLTWRAGESAAKQALDQFKSHIGNYGASRDIPSLDQTSHLSPHLRFGTISVREAVRTALKHQSEGARKWLMELIWREFYQDVLFHNPQVVTTTFNPDYANLQWPGIDEHFEAWKAGQTGYPLVDAAMRAFNETGWMHNRLRMVVASFLTKDLLVDYRKGEAHFASLLLDFDLASNNGGWQWAASVGCDAQPYFRIFNPYLQSLKFDSEGKFIRQWVPELVDLDNKSIHCPSEMEAVMCGYPLPIVDHAEQRQKAIALFSDAKRTATSS